MSGRSFSSADHSASTTAFPKLYRLLKTDEYSSVFSRRKALKSKHFLLHYGPRSVAETSGARLGLVIAKRLLRRSVDRNLVKRLARECFRLMHSRLRASDMVLRLTVSPKPLERKPLSIEIQRLLSKMVSPER